MRPYVIYNWLTVRSRVQPGFETVSVPALAEVQEALQGIPAEFVKRARHFKTEVEIEMERRVERDIAGVRAGREAETAPAAEACEAMEMEEEGPAVDVSLLPQPVFNHMAVLPKAGGGGMAESLAQLQGELTAIQEMMPGADPSSMWEELERDLDAEADAEEDRADVEAARAEAAETLARERERNRTIRVRRQAEPLNEFCENQTIIQNLFWYDFFLGRGISEVGSLKEKSVQHLLRYYDGRFAQNTSLLFFLVNQKQRHAHARASNGRVKDNPTSFKAFSEMVADPEFLKTLEVAQKDPGGKAAKAIFEKIKPHLVASGKQAPFSPMARSNAITQIINMARSFGLPSLFLTISPDDVHHPLALRLCFKHITNDTFPAKENGFVEALQGGETAFEAVLGLDPADISEEELQRLMAENPVAAAEVYQRMMHAVAECLLGLPVESGKVRKSTPVAAREGGLFGTPVAFFAVTETSGRKALHFHLIFWGGMAPELVQAAFPAHVAKVWHAHALKCVFECKN